MTRFQTPARWLAALLLVGAWMSASAAAGAGLDPHSAHVAQQRGGRGGHAKPAAGGGQRGGAARGKQGKSRPQAGRGLGPGKNAKSSRKPASPKAKPGPKGNPNRTQRGAQGNKPGARRQTKQAPKQRGQQENQSRAGGVQAIRPGSDPDARSTALALERAREQAAAERAMRLASSVERAERQRQLVASLIAERRASALKHSDTIRTMAMEREAIITRDQAYRAVSRRKSRPIMPPNRSFSPGARQGVTRGKKRGSEYYNKIIAKSLRGSRRGRRGGGRNNNNNNNGNF